jgi:hypothetical protein
VSLRIVGDMDVWKALFDLLTSNKSDPIVLFTPDRIEARNMDYNKSTLYELICPRSVFREYECPEDTLIKFDEYDLKRAFKGAGKGEATLRIEVTGGEKFVYLGETMVGKVVKPEEAEIPSIPELHFVNTVILDGVLFRRFLTHSNRAGAESLHFRWEDGELNIATVGGDLWDVFIEYPKEHLIGPEVMASCTGIYSLPKVLQFLPPSAVREKSTVKVYMTDTSDMPLHVVVEDLYPLGVEFRFWVAPQIIDSKGAARKTMRGKLAGGTLNFEDAALVFEHLYSNTNEPEFQFREDGVEARNMDVNRVSYARLYVPHSLFTEYSCVKPIYVVADYKSRDRVKELIAISTLFKRDVEFTVRENNNVYYDKTVIGHVKEEQEFKEPEVKIELKNMFEIGSRDFIKLFRDTQKKIREEKMTEAEYVAIAYDSKWPKKPMLYFIDEDVYEEVEVPVEMEEWDVGRFMSVFHINLIEQYFTPTLTRRNLPIRVSFDNDMPLKIETDLATIYIAPIVDEPRRRIAKKLNWLQPLTEEAIIEIVKRKSPERVSRGEIERELERTFIDIEKLDEVLSKMVGEGKLKRIEEGYISYFILPEAPTVLKPLTEEVVLEAIRVLCDMWRTDAVGFLELKAVLGKEYQTEPLEEILEKLRAKGLVEYKMWPEKREGPVRADMRGYWALKTAKPEEAVKRAEEVKLKPLTREIVLSVIEKLNDEVGENVKIDDVLRRLTDEGYDTAELSKFIDELKADKAVTVTLDGRIISSKYLEKVKPKPPPVPPGYVRVHFKRDMVRYIGMDRRYYGPFKSCEEAVIEKTFADAFKRAGYVEILTSGGQSSPSAPKPTEEGKAETWEEAKEKYLKWRIE